MTTLYSIWLLWHTINICILIVAKRERIHLISVFKSLKKKKKKKKDNFALKLSGSLAFKCTLHYALCRNFIDLNKLFAKFIEMVWKFNL